MFGNVNRGQNTLRNHVWQGVSDAPRGRERNALRLGEGRERERERERGELGDVFGNVNRGQNTLRNHVWQGVSDAPRGRERNAL